MSSGCARRSSASPRAWPSRRACACVGRLDARLPSLRHETELVIYRVAQESLTNVVRHADTREVELVLECHDAAVVLRVRDNGRGLDPASATPGERDAGDERASDARRRTPAHRAVLTDRYRGAPGGAGDVSVPLRTRILLADDHTVVRHGLRMILDAAPDLEVVAEAPDGIQAVEPGLTRGGRLAVLDVAMPRRTGLAAARELTRRRRSLGADALGARRRPVLL